MTLFSGTPRYQGNWWKNHSLSLVLAGLMIIQLVIVAIAGHFIFQWLEFKPDLTVSFTTAYWVWMTFSVTLSVVADTYGALLLVVASKWFFEKGSAESKDKDPDQA